MAPVESGARIAFLRALWFILGCCSVDALACRSQQAASPLAIAPGTHCLYERLENRPGLSKSPGC